MSGKIGVICYGFEIYVELFLGDINISIFYMELFNLFLRI